MTVDDALVRTVREHLQYSRRTGDILCGYSRSRGEFDV